MADIPDGLDATGIRMAIAWEIAKKGYEHAGPGAPEQRVEMLVNLFNQAYHGLRKEPKQDKGPARS